MPPHHLPLECWDRRELLGELWRHQQAEKNLSKELERRGQRDEWKWAYEVPVYGKTEKGATYLTSGFMLFDSAAEAYSKVGEIARQYERDPETAPYHVVKVWLPADHPASWMPLCENNEDCSRPKAGSPTGEAGDAQPRTHPND